MSPLIASVGLMLTAAHAMGETSPIPAFPRLRSYELPTIGKGYGLIRGIINGGMRSGEILARTAGPFSSGAPAPLAPALDAVK
jgi:hypothetical protein